MTYRLEVKESAEKQLRRLPDNVLATVTRRLLGLQDEPRPRGVKKLVGGLGWRIRVGNYRVVYGIDDERCVVTIVAVKPRQSAYR